MSDTVLAVTLAVISALSFALGFAVQQSEAAAAGGRGPVDARGGWRQFLVALMSRRRWWLGSSAVLAGAVLHVVALGLGSISLVQPIGVLSLVLALPISARLTGHPLRAAQWVSAGVLVLGLMGLVAVAPAEGAPWLMSTPTIVMTALAAIGAAGVIALLARSCRPSLRSVLQAAAAGVCFGATSAMIAILLALVSVSLAAAVVAGLAAAGLVAVGAMLLQTAYRDGGLGGPLATLTLVDPLVASVIGVVVVGERFSGGVGAVGLGVVSAVAVTGGLVALVRVGPAPDPSLVGVPTPQDPTPLRPSGEGPERWGPDGPLRVLIGADTFAPNVNGAARFAERLAEGLAGRGHDVHVVAPSPTGPPGRERRGAVTVHRVRSHACPGLPGFRVCLPAAARRATAALLDDLAPDVVHVQSHFAIGRGLVHAAGRAGRPVVATNHVMPENLVAHVPLPRSLRQAAYAWLWRDLARVFGQAGMVTAPTPRAVDLLVAAGLPRAVPVSCGIDVERYHDAPPDDPAADLPRVLFVGRLDQEKRVDELVRAVAALPAGLPAQLEIVGAGTCRRELTDLVGRLGVGARVRFLGLVSEDELVDAYARAAVFVMPSIAELQSLATMEAMAASTPVIAADAMALPHLARPGLNGRLYPPGDVPALTGHLTDLLTDPALRRRMGDASRDLVAEHALTATLATFEDLYLRVLDRADVRELQAA